MEKKHFMDIFSEKILTKLKKNSKIINALD